MTNIKLSYTIYHIHKQTKTDTEVFLNISVSNNKLIIKYIFVVDHIGKIIANKTYSWIDKYR